jgi:Mg-chelatase subunit ChlD
VIRFVHPEAFLLALPAGYLLWHWGRERPAVTGLRLLAVLGLLAVLAEPYRPSAAAGRDLILVVDASRSVGQTALDRGRELLEAARGAARPGDRIGLVAFGRDARLLVPPGEPLEARLDLPSGAVDADGTDLLLALDRGLQCIPPGRRGSVLLVSDGEPTGPAPWPAARAARRRGIAVDVAPLRRAAGSDIAVEELSVPGEVALGEPLRIVGWVRADRELTVPFHLLRDGAVIQSGQVALRTGPNRLSFRDLLAEAGVHRYELALEVEGDRVRENDRALAAVRVDAPPRLLLVAPGGRRGRLAAALEGSGLELEVRAPGALPASLDGLDPYAAVVVENVAAEDLPAGSMRLLQHFVEDLGGGLLMTGGRASFGVGGYRRSPLEEVLPVSMEIREEQRRFALAMAIALDRSGSMTAPAGLGRTKMDLANLGGIAALEMLGPNDEAAVIAVDSSPHVVVPLGPVDDLPALIDRVRRIEAGGGGIFVGVALEEMSRELAKSSTATRHMVLFADAADAEEPGAYRDFVPRLRDLGITLSVIALGGPADVDAALLLELARLGGGRCKFVEDANQLPRLFAQETIEVARSSFAESVTAVETLPDLLAVGEVGFQDFPAVAGYSIAWLEPGATVGLRARDETGAPLLAFWQRGLGRAAAFLPEADGAFSGDLAGWEGYAAFFATLGRWLAGSRGGGGVWASVRREGHEGVLRVELAPGAEGRADALRAVVLGPGGAEPLWLERNAARRLEARFPLDRDGVHRVAVQAGPGEVLRPAPVALPYSPEFEPRVDPEEGAKTLARLAEITAGRVDPPLADLLAGPRDSAGFEPLGAVFAWLALALVLLEIAVRRLELRFAWPAAVAGRLAARRGARAAARASAAPTAPGPLPPPGPAGPPQAEVPPADLGAVLDRARRRARGGR